MGDRTYDIELTCGCLVSLDCGGSLIPCSYDDDSDCKYKQEYLESPNYNYYEDEILKRN